MFRETSLNQMFNSLCIYKTLRLYILCVYFSCTRERKEIGIDFTGNETYQEQPRPLAMI